MADNGIRTKLNKNDETAPERVTGTAVTGDKRALDGYIVNPTTDPVNVNLVSPMPVITESEITNTIDTQVPTISWQANDGLEAIVNKLECLIDVITKQAEMNGQKGRISDGWGTGSKACVTSRGQLVTAPLAFSSMFSATASLDNIAVNIVQPLTGKQFVITDIILYANKGVGASDATVSIFESDGPISDAMIGGIFTQEMVKQTTIALSGLNIILSEGVWINLITDDNTVFVNIGGYYVDATT